MDTIWLRLRAPFSAYRYFQAGVYRASAPVIPHSAAWGLLLNLAAIDVRMNAINATTEINPEAPRLLIAIGAIEPGERDSIYQQLHSYPVGSSGKELAERSHGAKYWIAPVRREIVVGLDAVVGARTAEPDLLDRIRAGLRGDFNAERYGLPFAGDNNLLFDRIDVVARPIKAFWYSQLSVEDEARTGSCRLSVKIDRLDSSRSASVLCAPTSERMDEPPDNAWVWTPNHA